MQGDLAPVCIPAATSYRTRTQPSVGGMGGEGGGGIGVLALPWWPAGGIQRY